MPHRAGDHPLAGNRQAVAAAVFQFSAGHLDSLYLDPGATLAGQLKAVAGFQVDISQKVARNAARQHVVNDLFPAVIESAVDIVQKLTDQSLESFRIQGRLPVFPKHQGGNCQGKQQHNSIGRMKAPGLRKDP